MEKHMDKTVYPRHNSLKDVRCIICLIDFIERDIYLNNMYGIILTMTCFSTQNVMNVQSLILQQPHLLYEYFLP